jgi:hypothetical protein
MVCVTCLKWPGYAIYPLGMCIDGNSELLPLMQPEMDPRPAYDGHLYRA